eukprot:1156280-Pelagomonas_calceolata.AAC.3
MQSHARAFYFSACCEMRGSVCGRPVCGMPGHLQTMMTTQSHRHTPTPTYTHPQRASFLFVQAACVCGASWSPEACPITPADHDDHERDCSSGMLAVQEAVLCGKLTCTTSAMQLQLHSTMTSQKIICMLLTHHYYSSYMCFSLLWLTWLAQRACGREGSSHPLLGC